LRRNHRTARNGFERDWANEARSRPGHHGDNVVAALLKAAAHLHRLVGTDAAGYSKGDESHVELPTTKRQPPKTLDFGSWYLEVIERRLF
jgi:hypothetical protein